MEKWGFYYYLNYYWSVVCTREENSLGVEISTNKEIKIEVSVPPPSPHLSSSLSLYKSYVGSRVFLSIHVEGRRSVFITLGFEMCSCFRVLDLDFPHPRVLKREEEKSE